MSDNDCDGVDGIGEPRYLEIDGLSDVIGHCDDGL